MAAAGDIETTDWKELQAHLGECPPCRQIFTEISEVHSNWLPERDGFEIKRNAASEARLRRLILNRAVTEGARFSEEARSTVYDHPTASVAQVRSSKWRSVGMPLAAGVFLALAAAGATSVALRHRALAQIEAHVNSQSSAISSVLPADVSSPASAVTIVPTSKERELELALKKSKSETEAAGRRLAEAESKANDLQQVNSQVASDLTELRQELEVARTSEAKAEEELVRVRASQSEKDVQLVLAHEETRELREKLDQQSASIVREGELMSAGREIRDLIAARNLHIIDVYDTNGEGKTQRAFGRVFYTEGKSLVFYAYDLSARRTDSDKYAYYAWGKRDASEQGIRKLGIFFNDDQAQKRWVLQVTDPRVLSEIDSVFVTLEPADKPQPNGKRILSAFLRSPANHP
jgi:hypothetical protein